ncbi:MAG: polysaccharide biosynthesis/export family protein [Bacteroidota bacterium]
MNVTTSKYRKIRILKHVQWIILILLFSSCVSTKRTKLLQEKTTSDLSTEFMNQKIDAYKIQPGDQIYIRVFSVDPKTSRLFQTDMPLHYTNTAKELNSYKVNADGYINFSFIDKLQVKGLTEDEARELIQETVNEYFKEATVIVKLAYYPVSVMGEVKNPGTFNIENKEVNILQAISKAGGVETFGNREKVKLIRQTAEGSKIYELDVTDNGVLEDDQFYLLPNDVVYVEPMNTKNVAFEKVPYSLFVSTLTLGLTIYSLIK